MSFPSECGVATQTPCPVLATYDDLTGSVGIQSPHTRRRLEQCCTRKGEANLMVFIPSFVLVLADHVNLEA